MGTNGGGIVWVKASNIWGGGQREVRGQGFIAQVPKGEIVWISFGLVIWGGCRGPKKSPLKFSGILIPVVGICIGLLFPQIMMFGALKGTIHFKLLRGEVTGSKTCLQGGLMEVTNLAGCASGLKTKQFTRWGVGVHAL